MNKILKKIIKASLRILSIMLFISANACGLCSILGQKYEDICLMIGIENGSRLTFIVTIILLVLAVLMNYIWAKCSEEL